MKIILQIVRGILVFLLFSCVGIKNNKISTEQIIQTNENIVLMDYYKLDNESEYDIYFKIEKNGVYIIDEMYNIEFIISGNNTVERIIDDLLFFKNTNWYTWSLYNFKTKDYIEIIGGIDLIKYISKNEIEIIYKDNSTKLNFINEENNGKTIEFFEGDNGTEEIELFYYSMWENFNYQENRSYNTHKVKLFNKKVYIDTTDYVELSYDKRHNVFILCVYSSKGR